MSKKKHHHTGGQKQSPPAQKDAAAPKKSKTGLIIVAVVAVLVVGAFVATNLGGSKGGAAQPTAEEARYLGRLLPAGYEPLKVSDPVEYTSTVEMAELVASAGDTQITVPLTEVTSAGLVHFLYEGDVTKPLPLIAYVKPSGTLFVGVSFCPPCEGEWQTIQADGTLTCNSCGTKRDLESMAGISGSCKLYPLDELPVSIADGNIVIERSVLDSWTSQPLDRAVG